MTIRLLVSESSARITGAAGATETYAAGCLWAAGERVVRHGRMRNQDGRRFKQARLVET